MDNQRHLIRTVFYKKKCSDISSEYGVFEKKKKKKIHLRSAILNDNMFLSEYFKKDVLNTPRMELCEFSERMIDN